MKIFARDYGVNAGRSVGKELNDMFTALSEIDGDKEVIFDEGDYYIDSEDTPLEKLYITNTIGVKEWRRTEDYQMKHIAINIKNIKDMTIQGNGANFIMRGIMNNMDIMSSENITIRDINIDADNPHLHMITITAVSSFYFDFELDKGSMYAKYNGQYYFIGKDYKAKFTDSRSHSWWIGHVKAGDEDTIVRTMHPLIGVWRIKELSRGKFRAYTLIAKRMKVGDMYHLFDVRRKNVGIYIESSKDVSLVNVAEHFNYALGIVAVDSENITLDRLDMTPSPTRHILMASIADFIHLCMCRGDMVVTNGRFIGAGDDCLNVHGIHFQIVGVDGNKVVVRFMHPQAYGFNPLRVGDSIEYIDKDTLLPHGTAKILSSSLINEYDIELVLDDASGADTKYVIEDISACPNIRFENNYLNRIITRGILITTRGDVVVKDNIFNSCSMHSILFSDDAASWYESGMVKNALIKGNTFGYCPMYNVYIKPENKRHEGYVHGDFVIEDNTFNSSPNGGIYAKSTKSVILSNNKVDGELRIDSENVGEIVKK